MDQYNRNVVPGTAGTYSTQTMGTNAAGIQDPNLQKDNGSQFKARRDQEQYTAQPVPATVGGQQPLLDNRGFENQGGQYPPGQFQGGQYQGGQYQGGQYQGGQYQGGQYQGGQYQGGQFQGGQFPGGQYQSGQYQGAPYQGQYQGGQFQGQTIPQGPAYLEKKPFLKPYGHHVIAAGLQDRLERELADSYRVTTGRYTGQVTYAPTGQGPQFAAQPHPSVYTAGERFDEGGHKRGIIDKVKDAGRNLVQKTKNVVASKTHAIPPSDVPIRTTDAYSHDVGVHGYHGEPSSDFNPNLPRNPPMNVGYQTNPPLQGSTQLKGSQNYPLSPNVTNQNQAYTGNVPQYH